MVLRQILAANLRAARVEAGLSQEDLADSAGIDRTYVSALERSRYAATVDVLQKLADAFSVEAWTLLQQR
ncbi:XRE family transcriptional regulator [Novosphingobium sp. AAP83]|nr:XRE family transcriptional regulator [Novosphingobium sp. AAP83]